MMNEEIRERFRKRSARGRVFTGFFLLLAGAALFLQRISNPFPGWLFTWPVFFIALGLLLGIRKKFRGIIWFMLILSGGFFLAGDIHPEWNIRQYAVPVMLIAAGLAFMLRPKRHPFSGVWGDREDWHKAFHEKKNAPRERYGREDSDEDLLDIVSVLGGTKKMITSKDFKGGEVTSFLGGTELNLSSAEINGRVVLDLTQVLGGTKLIVPAHWDLKPELTSVFGSVEDRRLPGAVIDPSKILVLKGSSVFGGIEIRSF